MSGFELREAVADFSCGEENIYFVKRCLTCYSGLSLTLRNNLL